MKKQIPNVPPVAEIRPIEGTPYIIIDGKHVARFLTPTVVNNKTYFNLFLNPNEGSRHALEDLVEKNPRLRK
jgi:hypothetical protein